MNPNKDRGALGDILRRDRRVVRMTQRELADQTGVSNSHISKIESGKEIPSIALLGRLADVLRADLDELTLAAGRLPDDVLRHLVADPDLARKVISYVRLAVTP